MEYLAYLLAVYYCTQVLLYTETGLGPFPSRNSFVEYVEEVHDVLQLQARPVHLWDRVRWLFRAYNITGHTWSLRADVWVCPKCLSFWIALVLFPVLLLCPILLYPLSAAGFVTYFYDKS